MRKTLFVLAGALMVLAATPRSQSLNESPSVSPLGEAIPEKMLELQRAKAEAIFAVPGVQAFCIGATKASGGVFHVYGTSRLGLDSLPHQLGPFPVIPVETGIVGALASPAPVGTSTSNNAGPFSGTLGMMATDKNGNPGYITNDHVAAATPTTICPDGSLSTGRVTTEVAPGRSATHCDPPQVIGKLAKVAQPIILSPNYQNVVDAAFVRAKAGAVSAVPACGICPTVHGALYVVDPVYALHTTVRKCSAVVNDSGCSSKRSCGTVADIHCMVRVLYPGCGLPALFVDQIEIDGTQFATAGDSGSVVFDHGSGVVGLLFAGDGNTHAFANPMDVVLKKLEVNMAPIPCDRDVPCNR